MNGTNTIETISQGWKAGSAFVMPFISGNLRRGCTIRFTCTFATHGVQCGVGNANLASMEKAQQSTPSSCPSSIITGYTRNDACIHDSEATYKSTINTAHKCALVPRNEPYRLSTPKACRQPQTHACVYIVAVVGTVSAMRTTYLASKQIPKYNDVISHARRG